ncbi:MULTISPECIES: fimbrial protein [Klebsiella]|uniref:fimbrial protein n=1 Tax=Klebsiella TaxID=570 RepID=UPI000DDED288|nr:MULTISPECIES: fimbrial protein [Klebsiella]EKZ9672115.1 type 1 fimbrial protein [Klebsiella aerogenes]ELA2276472.1 type 1 fimbrial protein [Klebsiella aerogenes]MDU9367355.1 fimbrial protein [Klebsiella sp. 141203]HBR7308079.1 type 1 fimbrial protein [Klebsiella aerogenes]HBS5678392.1 type 1 fimbrial protein [Klebsiella aerogenes]
MKKTIVAVMVAASAVLSAQAMAANTAEVTVLGEVNDSSASCVVTPTGTLNNGIVRLTSVTTSEANAQAANTLFKSQKFGFDVSDCAQGSKDPATGLTVAVTGTTSSNATILDNTADDGAAGIGIGIAKVSDGSRVAFDGSQTMSETYTDGSVTSLNYYAGYVKVNATTAVTEGPVKGVATFTIDYTI